MKKNATQKFAITVSALVLTVALINSFLPVQVHGSGLKASPGDAACSVNESGAARHALPGGFPLFNSAVDQTRGEVKEVGPELGANFSLDGFIINPLNPRQVLASSLQIGVSKSTNGGQTWFRANGLTDSFGLYPDAFNIRKDPGNPLGVYAVSGDGLFHSTDFGDTWTNLGALFSAADCAIDPTSPNVIFVLPKKPDSTTLAKSTDGGLSFEELGGNGLPDFESDPFGSFRSMAIAPTNHNVLYVVASGDLEGVYRSTDGGASFARLDNSPSIPVQVFPHPTQADTIYLQALDGSTGLFRSTDGGETFDEVMAGLPPDNFNNFVVFNPSDPRTLYVAGFGGLFRSVDSGSTFAPLGLSEEQKGVQAITLGIDPTNPDVIYVNTSRGNFKSANGGLSFEAINRGWQVSIVSHIAFDDHSSPNLYVATDSFTFDDVKLLRTPDSGQRYEPIGRSLPSGVRVSSIAASVNSSDLILITTFRHGILRSTDGGRSWTAATTDTGQVGFSISQLAIDPADSSNVYATCGNLPFRGFYRSTDGGRSFTRTMSLEPFGGSNALAVDPSNPNVVYTATRATLHKSTDAGLSFTATQLSPFGSIFDIVVNPQDSRDVYVAGVALSQPPTFSRIVRSSDGGATFVPAEDGLGGFHPVGLVIDPANPSRLFSWMFGGGLFMTDDGGTHWSLLEGDEALRRSPFGRTLAINPKKPDRIYLGGAGVLEIRLQ